MTQKRVITTLLTHQHQHWPLFKKQIFWVLIMQSSYHPYQLTLEHPVPITAIPIYRLTECADGTKLWAYAGKRLMTDVPIAPHAPLPTPALDILAEASSRVSTISEAIQNTRTHVPRPVKSTPLLAPLNIERARKLADFEIKLWEMKLSEGAKQRIRRLVIDTLY